MIKDLVKIIRKTTPCGGRDYIWENLNKSTLKVYFNADFTDFCFGAKGDVKVPGTIGVYSPENKVGVKISLTKAEKTALLQEKKKERKMRFLQEKAILHMANMGVKSTRYYDGMLDFRDHGIWLSASKVLTLKNIDEFYEAEKKIKKGFATIFSD